MVRTEWETPRMICQAETDRKKKSAGFTLIETMVVILLLGAFFSVAMPKLLGTGDANLRRASRGVITAARYLHSRAAFEKQVHRLSFDLQTGQYWAEVLENGEYVHDADFSGARRKLPPGISFLDIQTERTQGKVKPGRDAFIFFMPNGTVDSAVIHLRADGGASFTLSTNPYTGAMKVFDSYIEFEDRFDNIEDNFHEGPR